MPAPAPVEVAVTVPALISRGVPNAPTATPERTIVGAVALPPPPCMIEPVPEELLVARELSSARTVRRFAAPTFAPKVISLPAARVTFPAVEEIFAETVISPSSIPAVSLAIRRIFPTAVIGAFTVMGLASVM
jgi:hypothetical protein